MNKLSLLTISILLIGSLSINAQIAEKAEDISPLLIGEKIPDITLMSTEGKQETLASITEGKPSILLFYRGGWCPFCNRHLAEIGTIQDEILGLGYKLIAISPDAPSKLISSSEKNKIKYSLYSDGDGAVARAMGIAFKASERSLARLSEYSDGQNTGYLPVPAVFVINREGVIAFEYINPDYKVRISAKLLLAVLENLD
ncbi:MAG: peroxiredoxin-like family protein [Bacteroidales bacterium]|nr:peroxiredoxin-like family protein [Bacteroidales bacterium]MDT8374252.1 peroxiredoxin-like family protein [Bacteroidales bacterium]